MRTGPLVRRGANASRAVQGGSPLFPRPSIPKPSRNKQVIPFRGFSLSDPTRLIESSCFHLECRLPINLRRFLADQMGAAANADNDTILNVAANADEHTLSKLARAIRRYSTERAHEAWVECSVALAHFEAEARGKRRPEAALCLRCARVDLGAHGAQAHRGSGCLMVNLTPAFELGAEPSEPHQYPARITAERLQRVIEEFRALRAAFGLPHYELDCYLTNSQVTLSWRPLPR